VFTPLVLSPYGGWHGDCGNEQWTSRTTHTGDDAPFLSYDERFEHPAQTRRLNVPDMAVPNFNDSQLLGLKGTCLGLRAISQLRLSTSMPRSGCPPVIYI
jgi:hypothetical protein